MGAFCFAGANVKWTRPHGVYLTGRRAGPAVGRSGLTRNGVEQMPVLPYDLVALVTTILDFIFNMAVLVLDIICGGGCFQEG